MDFFGIEWIYIGLEGLVEFSMDGKFSLFGTGNFIWDWMERETISTWIGEVSPPRRS